MNFFSPTTFQANLIKLMIQWNSASLVVAHNIDQAVHAIKVVRGAKTELTNKSSIL